MGRGTVAGMLGPSGQVWHQAEELRRLVPVFALIVALVAAITDPSSSADFVLGALPVVGFALWAYRPKLPLWAISLLVLVPVVVAQRDGQLEPLMFDATLFGFVAGRWAPSQAAAVGLGMLALTAPVFASLIQDPAEIAVGIWFLGIAFPWVVGRAAARERQLATQLDATRRELAEQALHDERRRIARDVHDLVGHGLAATMLQITSARHVLRRDLAAAEEALLSAEEVGRRSMEELRRTVALLRSDEKAALAPPPSARDITTLVDDARASGLAVELRGQDNLAQIAPNVGLALYRISQEALANAARHAPSARTVIELELANGQACLVAETTGPLNGPAAAEPKQRRYGLIGMRERATALGGEFEAGATPKGWRVTCRLPLRAEGQTGVEEVDIP